MYLFGTPRDILKVFALHDPWLAHTRPTTAPRARGRPPGRPPREPEPVATGVGPDGTGTGSAGSVLLRTRHGPDMVGDERGALEVEDLLKIVLVLVIVYLVVNIVFDVIEGTLSLLFGLPNLIGLLIVVLIVAWFLDYL